MFEHGEQPKFPSFGPNDMRDRPPGAPEDVTYQQMYTDGVNTMTSWHARVMREAPEQSTTQRLQASVNSLAIVGFSHSECAGMLAICLDRLAALTEDAK